MFGSLNYGAPGPSGTTSGSQNAQGDPYQQQYGQHLFLQQPIQVYPQQTYSIVTQPQTGTHAVLDEQFVFDDSAPASHVAHHAGANTELCLPVIGRSVTSRPTLGKSTARTFPCDLCNKEYRNRALLRKHIVCTHEGNYRSLSGFWCNEANCDFQTLCRLSLLKHLEEQHGRHMDKIKMTFDSFGAFYRWKNHLEESNPHIKYLLSTAVISNGKPTETYTFECYRAHGRRRQESQEGTEPFMDVMEKAVREILPEAPSHQGDHEMDIVSTDDLGLSESRKGVRRTTHQSAAPCVAYIQAEHSAVEDTVEVTACLSHYAHDMDKLSRPPDCVLGRVRQLMLRQHTRQDITEGLSSWTKHDLNDTTWRLLERMTSVNSTLFAQFRAVSKKAYDHLAAIIKLSSQFYWMDFMENLAELFVIEHKLKVIRQRMTAKVKEADATFVDSTPLGAELAHSILQFATGRDELKKLLKYGMDYADDPRASDPRYEADFSSLSNKPIYDASASLFKPRSGTMDSSQVGQRPTPRSQGHKRSSCHATAADKRSKYRRTFVGSEDDSDYDWWSDEDLMNDVIPRRWPPPPSPQSKSTTTEEKRLEKNLRRKQVPSLDIKPELREKILAMRMSQQDQRQLQPHEVSDEGSGVKASGRRNSAKTARDVRRASGKARRSARRTRRSRRSRTAGSSDEASEGEAELEDNELDQEDHEVLKRDKDDTQEISEEEEEERRPHERTIEDKVIVQELRVEGPAGKKPRTVKVFAEVNSTNEFPTIVVEDPPPTPQQPDPQLQEASQPKPARVMTSLLRPGVSLLKAGGRSLLKTTPPSISSNAEIPGSTTGSGTVSLLRKTSDVEWKVPTPAVQPDHPDDLDEGPLRTPQPPRIED